MDEAASRRWLFLVGPTASGKTAVAVHLARLLEGEVIGLDSMQVYRGLPVLTAAPDEGERAAVPHHLVGVRDPDEPLDVARYRELAMGKATEVAARGHVPILAGGSGLHFSAIVDGLSELPRGDPELRDELAREERNHPPGWLHSELARLDPVAAAKLHPNDRHRVLRALEVCRLTGRPYSEQTGRRVPLPRERFRAYGLDVPRPMLYRRIDERTGRMLEEGAMTEAAWALGVLGRIGVRGSGGGLRTAGQMLGLAQLGAYLAGELPREEALRLLARDTRHFARRQLKWFHACKAICWIAAGDRSAVAIAGEIAELWSAAG